MTRAAKLLPEIAEAIAVVTAAPQRPLFPAIEVADTAKAIAARAARIAHLRREAARLEREVAKIEALRDEVDRLDQELFAAQRALKAAAEHEDAYLDQFDEARAALAKEEASC